MPIRLPISEEGLRHADVLCLVVFAAWIFE